MYTVEHYFDLFVSAYPSTLIGVYGDVPQLVLDEEEDFLRYAHSSNCDLVMNTPSVCVFLHAILMIPSVA